MDQTTLQELKQMLEQRKQELIKQLETVGHKAEGEDNYDANFPQYGDSAEDNAIEVADYATNLSLERELEPELKDIDKALERIKEGTYGKCEKCGQDIDLARLKVMPSATECVKCK